MDELTIPFLAPGRAALQYPFRSLAAAGARLAGGSDWSVSTPNVMAEIEVAVNRIGPEAREATPFLPAEALDLQTALAAFTNGSAWVNHLDEETGSIETGKLADLVVLDRDIQRIDPRRLGDARVLLTLIEGVAVHEDPGLERP
jgi:predicted amidohydrolase YtcJ